MPLTSRLFKSSQRLQACLTNHAAHVTPGDAGPHVHLIQLALMIIDDLAIADAEYSAKRYGPTTTSAVLAYKKKRRIINRSYQTSEDNIVGKMTIASLDQDMLELEQAPAGHKRPVGCLCACEGAALPALVPETPRISRMTCERIAAECRNEAVA